MIRVHPRRLLFVQPRLPANLAPILLAILSLALLAVVVLLVASWPQGNAQQPEAHGAGEGRVAPAGGDVERGLRVPQQTRKPGARTVWM